MTSAQMDLVDQVGAAVNATDDPKALKARIVAELRSSYPDFVPPGAKTDEAVFANVLRTNPDLIEQIRTVVFVHQDVVAPLEAVVAGVMTAAMAGLEPDVTLTIGRRFRER